MNKRTRLILSIIGAAAIIVPAVLLIFVTSRDSKTPQVPTEKRQIDAENVEQKAQKTLPGEDPTPTPGGGATESAQPYNTPSEGTPSGQ